MKTILITGGAGFIGSHLSQFLLERGERVIVVDNFFTGSKKNIEHLLSNPNFKLIEQDIIEPFFVDEKIDQIFNLACPASPVHYQSNAVRTIKANTVGVINVLGLARKHGARVFQASTSEVYGDPEVHPQTEEYRGNVSTIGPRACYDEGKRVAETLFFDYKRMHGMQIRVARIFNTYGPRMAKNDGRVVSNFIVQALAGKPMTIYGDGSHTRSFCYVSDLVAGFYALMNTENFEGPVNLGNPTELTIKDIAEKVRTMTASVSQIVHEPLPLDDPRKRKPDISLAATMLGWTPRVSLDEGLTRTIDYFKTVQ